MVDQAEYIYKCKQDLTRFDLEMEKKIQRFKEAKEEIKKYFGVLNNKSVAYNSKYGTRFFMLDENDEVATNY